jgi:aspartate racemase
MNTVGILGGMGPAAGADFVRLFVEACAKRQAENGDAVNDQAFPEHWLAQVPVPDRTLALEHSDCSSHQPLEPMLQALGRLGALGVRSVAIACNTAHAWHAQLQAGFPQIELLHIAHEVASYLRAQGAREVALMATEGTFRTGIYADALALQGIVCHVPSAAERSRITQGIFKGIKGNDFPLAESAFAEVALALSDRHTNAPIVMGCTEIPLGLKRLKSVGQLRLIDPARILADALAERAYAPERSLSDQLFTSPELSPGYLNESCSK